jgi:hypothetical protein
MPVRVGGGPEDFVGVALARLDEVGRTVGVPSLSC